MKAADYNCLFLGRTADHYHHATGRDAAGRYLDPDLVVPLSSRQHVAEHQGWRIAGFGEDSSLPDNLLRIYRLGHLLVRMGEHHGIGAVVIPATVVRETGRAVQRIAREWEAR